ncbi:ROK family transcriptional regulator [Aeromicrobium fastidiosum]|uniref:ROK family transcriptional regulator n=1 Tax=Aeromicrobium fastidiosum TaxID=52699 RepID=A0A641AKP9_9ACTN|nr:ROK family transcriptional regulator [Aeromicrobium fastidiosum]KAA1375943.1 ROK family transcriptional regulator [Aeromicrobium fastidiosum]MBP2392201.1 putative NBD/HSP70 family sugar kinase [Aeromicrobium fastidiosum]
MASAGRAGVGTNQEDIRRHNLGTVLGHVHRAGRLSRAELTTRMGLNRSTIAGLVAELESLGLAEQAAPTGARLGAGRPSVDVKARSGAYVLAVDLRVDGLTVARVGLGGVIQSRATGPVPVAHDPHAISDSVVELMRLVVKDVEPDSVLVGVGVGVPGIIRAEDGLVRLAPNLDWHDVPFAQILGDRLGAIGTPVLGNDADLGALAEHLRGAGVGVEDLVYLSGEVGVGAGVIVSGHKLEGAGGYAGEIGHMPFHPEGKLCHCGARGCWETEIGADAIAAAIGCPPERVGALGEFLEGVHGASPELRLVGSHLGRGIAGIVNMLNPRVIVLGGYLRPLFPLVQDDVEAQLEVHALTAPRELVRVALPGLGGDSVLHGAAELAFEPLLADPVERLASACHDADAALAS